MLVFDLSQLQWLPSILFLTVLTFLLLKKEKNERMKGIKVPPGPPKLPLIGSFHLLGNFPHRSLEKLSKKYGSIMLLQLGSVPTVIVSSAKTTEQRPPGCCTRPASPGPNRFSYNGLDEMHKIFIFELLSMKRVQYFAYAREAKVDKLITSLSQASPKPVNLNEKIFALADDQLFHNVLGEAMNMLDSFLVEDFFTMIGRIIDALTGLSGRLEKSFHQFDGYLQMVLDQYLDHARPKPEQEDLVDFLIRLMKDESNIFRVTENCVRAMLFDAFMGGIVTTSTTILRAMSELKKNPRVMNKVQAGIRNCIGKKAKTFRLYPLVPILPSLEAMREFKVGEFDILPKTRILENPSEFYPERFKGSRIDFRRSDFNLLLLDMRDTKIEFSLANILYWFDWEVPNDMKREDIIMEE
ncbi:hypothetical protein ES332_D11G247000v1 [Gossypium tomentosum]|uniref:Cytochrome P450 n=1 Tax=Gossypium tomentosum TaxID=34277 RepID=A0A5D2ISW1_GOSTO|nr:hypothetical protein ES332_D11G247000v1 [Gossypium tomentosum]